MTHECMSPATHGGIGCSQCARLWEEIQELRQTVATIQVALASARVARARAVVEAEERFLSGKASGGPDLFDR